MNQNKNFRHHKFPLSKMWLVVSGGILISSVNSYAADDSNTLTVTAHTAKQQADTGYSSPESSIASKTPTSKLDEAQSISVVTNKQLEDYQASSVADAMRFVSGTAQSNTLGEPRTGLPVVVLAPTQTVLFSVMASAAARG